MLPVNFGSNPVNKSKFEQVVSDLTKEEAEQVSGGATLNEKSVNVRDWDASVIEGCCNQDCCSAEH